MPAHLRFGFQQYQDLGNAQIIWYNEVTSRSCLEALRKPQKASVGISGDAAEIRTEHLPNIIPNRCHWTNQVGRSNYLSETNIRTTDLRPWYMRRHLKVAGKLLGCFVTWLATVPSCLAWDFHDPATRRRSFCDARKNL
jgi:hypothetical protein